MKIAIYQIAIERDENRLAFQSLNHIISVSNGRVPAKLYDCVFAGEVSAQTLEDIFYVFNMEHPSGYKGRSLSVSDVVEIFLASGESEFYYCEPIGFKRIRFERSKPNAERKINQALQHKQEASNYRRLLWPKRRISQ